LIDTKALRSKVLDLAIQGKLTEQLESDGTAEELYQQIQEEKQKLIKEGKIKATSELPTVTDEEKVFDVPVNWKWTHFGNIAYIVRGGSPRPIKQYITNDINGINWIKIGDVEKGGKYIFNTREKIIPEGEKKSRRVYPGDFLLTNSMSFGRPYISKIEGCIHDGWLLIRNLNGFNTDYLYYLLSSSYLYAQFCNKAVGATVDNLNIEKVCSALIPLPPLAEQKRIVERVEEIFKYLNIIDEAQKKYSADAEILKNKLITMGIQGKLTKQLDSDGTAEELYQQIQEEKQKLIKEKKIPKEQKLPSISKEEISFNIPCNWKWVRVQDIATYITDYVANGSFATLKAHTKTYKEPNYALFVRIMDLSCNFSETCSYIDKESYDFLSKSQLFGGELILPNIGASIGKAFIMPNLNMPMSLAPNSILLKFTDTSMNKYFSYIVKSSFGQNLLTKSQGGSATAKFSKTDLRKLVVPLPPLAEQKRIADTLDEVLRVIG